MIEQFILWGGIIACLTLISVVAIHIVHHTTKHYTNKQLAETFERYENETRAKLTELSAEYAALTAQYESINNMLQANGLTRSGFRQARKVDPNTL